MADIESPADRALRISLLAGEIAGLTDINDHGGAAIMLAAALPNCDAERKKLVSIKEAHIKRGHISHEDYHQRETICQQLLIKARAHFFGPGEYDQIYAGF